MRVRLTGCANSFDGYGQITEGLALALDQLGVEVQIKPVAAWYDHNSLKPRAKELVKNNLRNIDFELLILYPTFAFGSVHKNAAILTMWEADKLPTVWVDTLNKLRLPIFSPSRFSTEVFKSSGVTQKIIDFPLGLDKEFYGCRVRTYPEDRPFRFLSIGKFEPRKNGDTLLRCFQQAFPSGDVELFIKSRERFLPSHARANTDPRIKFMARTISEVELRDLYYSCDAFVYPSRGEAFSFPPRNAVLTGMPTLVTDWSALREIPGVSRIPVSGLSPMHPCGFSYGEEKELLMADIHESAFEHQMERMATDPKHYASWAEYARDNRDSHLSWNGCAKNLIKYVENGRIDAIHS